MTSESRDGGGWGRFMTTLTAVVDLARERDRQEREAEATSVNDNEPGESFRFAPMAAATAEVAPLPTFDNPLFDVRETLKLWIEEEGEGETLRVHLKSLDFETGDELAGRWVTVTIGRHLMSLSVQFDDNGGATFDLPDVPDCRAALSRTFSIEVPGDRFTFRSGDDGDDASH